MSIRRVKIVLLCEDSQHEAFARRFLGGMGWNTREIRVEKSPSAGGSAEQWVRERFPKELNVYRHRRQLAASAMIAIIDADAKGVNDRVREFKEVCDARQMKFRYPDEAVAIVVPKRNIETWIHYLNGNSVNEQETYSKLDRERGCRTAVDNLIKICNSEAVKSDTPPALTAACDEYKKRIMPLRNSLLE
jgi:hypothetical protein